MNKLLAFAAVSAVAFSLSAQDVAANNAAANAEGSVSETQAEPKIESTVWPAYIAVCQWPHAVDMLGLRLTIPFSTSQDNVTGIDVGFWGRSLYFEGVQVNVIRNNVEDSAAGVQVGLYNSIGSGEMLGVQVGLWNEAMSFRGVQAGLVNVVGEAQGLQVGIINRAETMYGYQVGVINVIRDAELQFMPIINIGF